ncbi:MAG: hypothetical protein ACOYYJ_00540 [Chloroflexota bacterium]
MKFSALKDSRWVEIILLALVSALAYLPDVLALGYYRDDWYYMYDGLVFGPKIFEIMFLHLRPARGPFFAALFSLFGNQPLPYHLLLYAWRLLGGLGMLWLFDLLWPGRRNARFFTALMFTIYPGFLWWVAGVEYQPMVFSLGLHVFSIALTLKGVQATTLRGRASWYALSLLAGWYALSLVEYAFGMEALRWMGIYLLAGRDAPSVKKRLVETLKLAAPFLLLPLGWLAWRLFFFENWRKAAEIGLQLGEGLGSGNALLWSLIHLVQGALNVSVFAWGVPFGSLFYANRLKDILPGLVFALGGLAVVLAAERAFSNKTKEAESHPWIREAVLLGALGTLAGALPVVLGNRVVTFERFSHYTLPASIAGVLFLAGLVYAIKDRLARMTVIGLLVGLALLTHRSLSAQARNEQEMIRDFWWQMSWRAPGLQEGVTLVVAYPFSFADDVDVVYGPANYIYFPEKQAQAPVQLAVNAEVVRGDTVEDILLGRKNWEVDYYGAHVYHVNFGNVLIVTQPSASSCLRALDARWPDYSVSDGDWVFASASQSKIENILPDTTPPELPATLFGDEPEHEWCYYYQKADLARQAGDWETVAQLGDQAEKLGYRPNDQIELLPFLQAYAWQGEAKKVKQLSTRINTEPWYKRQACAAIQAMPEHGFPLQPEMQSLVDDLFCGAAQ